MSLVLLPADTLVDIYLRVVAPPFPDALGALARTCRAMATVSRSHAFWAGRLRAAYPEASPETADAEGLRAAYITACSRACAQWRGALERARAALDVPPAGCPSETTAEWTQIAPLCGALRAGCSETAAAFAELLAWACTTKDSLAIACALVVLDASGRFGGQLAATFTNASARSPSVRAEPVRILSWSLGGKDLRGYRCRDDMCTYALTLAQLADPERCADAASALMVLRRGIVHEVRRVALEVPQHPPL